MLLLLYFLILKRSSGLGQLVFGPEPTYEIITKVRLLKFQVFRRILYTGKILGAKKINRIRVSGCKIPPSATVTYRNFEKKIQSGKCSLKRWLL